MSLRDEVVGTLRRVFPDAPFDFTPRNGVIASIVSPNPALGTLTIEDDGDELTLTIGEFTHGHFNRFDLSGSAADSAVAEDLAAFLQALFNDRVVVWRSAHAGGWVEPGPEPDRAHGGHDSQLWSRPVTAAN